MRAYIVEGIWTCFLMLSILLSVTYLDTLAPVVIWATLMVMIYAWGHISGAHFNPAVSRAMYLHKQLSTRMFLGYLWAQILWALLGYLFACFLSNNTLSTWVFSAWIEQIIIAELLFTFALVRVIFHVAIHKETKGNSFYGLAIWSTVLAWAYLVGSISWGSFNPAVSIIGIMSGLFSGNILRMHLVGQCIWASLAYRAYRQVTKA